MRLVLASRNRNKLAEISAVLGPGVELVTLDSTSIQEEIPETSDTLEGNAAQKARYVYSRTGLNCMADDTGLEVRALGGAPGVRSARYATDGHDSAANRRLLLENLSGAADRTARFRTVICLILDGEEFFFEGTVSGTIALSESGENGFGYDSLFVPEDRSETFAEMSDDEKNRISHRARAVEALNSFLSSYQRRQE